MGCRGLTRGLRRWFRRGLRWRPAQVFRCEAREHEVDEDVVVARLETHLLDLPAAVLNLRLQQVRGPDRDRFLAAEHQPPQLVVGGERRPAGQTPAAILQLLRHGGGALATDPVLYPPGSDHLADRTPPPRALRVRP